MRMWSHRKLCALFLGRQNSANAMENRMAVLQKSKIDLVYDPATPLLGTYPKDLNAGSQKILAKPHSQQHYSQ